MWMEVRFPEKTRTVTRVPYGLHPCRSFGRHLMVHVIPDTRIVWIQTRRQAEPRRDTDRRCRDTIRKS